MPPRLSLTAASLRLSLHPSLLHPIAPVVSFLGPFVLSQSRSKSILSSLSDNRAAYNKRIRRGRGPSSGKGKTSGRGHKGQKQHGKVPAHFQGGQTPLDIVHGKRGFNNQFSVDMSPVNLDRIQEWIDQGRLDTSRPITLRELVKSRCIHGIKDGVKLLGRGSETLKAPINIIVSRASESAIAAVEAVGGSVTTRYYTAASIRRILLGKSPAYTPALVSMTPDMDPYKEPAEWTKEIEKVKRYEYRLPDPTKRKDLEYYRDVAHRGYLSHLVPEGQGPSLFFKTPRKFTERKTKEKKGGVKTTPKAENRIW